MWEHVTGTELCPQHELDQYLIADADLSESLQEVKRLKPADWMLRERAAHYWTWSQNHTFNHIWLEWLLVHILLAMFELFLLLFLAHEHKQSCVRSGFSARSLKVFRGHLRSPFLLLGLIGVKELTPTSLLCLYLRQQNTAGPPGSPGAGRHRGAGKTWLVYDETVKRGEEGKRKEDSRCGPPCWACK